ncbi:zearalenone lactonase [Xylaria grammica]|nr:zearalenone lactonase [Xylaria grammica]
MATEFHTLELSSGRDMSFSFAEPPGGSYDFILLANPFGTTLEIWDHVVLRCTAAGFNVIRYELPGHGFSTAPEDLDSTTIHTLVQDVLELLEDMDVQKLDAWIGVGLGAAIGVAFAARYANYITRLVVCDTITCSPVNAGVPDFFRTSSAALASAGGTDDYVDDSLRRWFGDTWLGANEDEAERVRFCMLDATVEGLQTCLAALSSPTFDLRLWASRAGLHIKSALLLVGENDSPGLYQMMEELQMDLQGGLRMRNPGAVVRLVKILGAGHVPFVDSIDSFLALVFAFLAE